MLDPPEADDSTVDFQTLPDRAYSNNWSINAGNPPRAKWMMMLTQAPPSMDSQYSFCPDQQKWRCLRKWKQRLSLSNLLGGICLLSRNEHFPSRHDDLYHIRTLTHVNLKQTNAMAAHQWRSVKSCITAGKCWQGTTGLLNKTCQLEMWVFHQKRG